MTRSARPRRARAAILAAVLLAAACLSACGGRLFAKRYEYEEDMTLALDGSATITVNASVPALAALRGLDIATSAGRVDRDKVRALFETPVSDVTRVSRPWRREGRPFVQVRVSVPDIRRLSEARPFAWSRYELAGKDGEHVFRQTVGPSALKPGTLKNVGWKGSELVAFRVHLPSRILEHNARDVETDEASSVQRGNILAWEQHLADRLDGKPVTIAVRISSQSILYRTLWLFAGAFAAAVLVLVGIVWWTMRRGGSEVAGR